MEHCQVSEKLQMDEKRRTKVMVGVFLGFVNMMVVFGMIIPATPIIIADLGKLEIYSMTWTIFLLTSTIVMPMAGNLGDIYGRRIEL